MFGFSTAIPGAAYALAAAMNDAWFSLTTLDPTVRTAGLVVFAIEVAAIVAIRVLSARQGSEPLARTPVDDLHPRYSDAA